MASAPYSLARIVYLRPRPYPNADRFADQPESIRPALVEAHIFQTFRRDLMNLNLQQSRLSRRREKEIAELKDRQKERLQKREHDLNAAGHMYERFKKNGEPFDPAAFGFEFSIDEIERRVGLWKASASTANTPNSSPSYAPGSSAKNAWPLKRLEGRA